MLASKDGGEPTDKLFQELSTIYVDNIRAFKNDVHLTISELKGDLK